MNASRTAEPVMWRGALIGALLFFGLSMLVRFWVLEHPPALPWLVGAFVMAGGLVGHLGMRNSLAVVAPACGLALGMFIGAILGDETGRYIPIDEPELASTATQDGQPMDIAGPTLDGSPFDVKDWHGKVVLVDFWATWCPPCVAEMPNVKATYNRFHKSGFEIVGVSLDQDRDSLTEFVKRHEMPWPQVIFQEPGLRGWDSPLVRKYQVHAIPAMFLLDREGRIASAEPRGEKLMQMVEQQMTGVRVGLFPMGLFLGACIGGYVGIQLGNFADGFVRRKRNRAGSAVG